MSFSEIFSWGYFFSHQGLDSFPHFWTYTSIAIALLVLGIVSHIYTRLFLKNSRYKKTTKFCAKTTLWFSVVAFFFVWMRTETVPYLALRFWWVLYFIFFVVIYIYIFRKFLKKKRQIGRIVVQTKSTSDLDKYLPSQKRKKKKRK